MDTIVNVYEGSAPRYKTMKWKEAFTESKLFSLFEYKAFHYCQKGPAQMIIDRVASISFIGALPKLTHDKVLGKIQALLETHPETKDRAEIELPDTTDVYWCRAEP